MRKFRFFAALCCAAAVFAACEKAAAATGTVNGHDWVNLGLPSGTKWATCNVGADTPEEYGNYYAWGETKTKDNYSEDTYKYSRYSRLTKYCTNSSYGKGGFTDNLTTLVAKDDAATANWGKGWRMPTDAEWTELHKNCTWTWTTLNGVKGYEVKGPNGNTIFLPAAGRRYDDNLGSAGSGGGYWSSSLNTDSPDSAWEASFNSVIRGGFSSNRYYGQSVRPVLK